MTILNQLALLWPQLSTLPGFDLSRDSSSCTIADEGQTPIKTYKISMIASVVY
jgi:hypothetical protein